MAATNDGLNRVSEFINSQRSEIPDQNEIHNSLKGLNTDEIVQYLSFLETEYGIMLESCCGGYLLERLGITNAEFVDRHAKNMNALNFQGLWQLIETSIDRLLQTYLELPKPNSILDEYILGKALKINRNCDGRYKKTLDLIHLAVKLNAVADVNDLMPTFLNLDECFFKTNQPAVDVSEFYQLIRPILERIQSEQGREAFFEARDQVIIELSKYGLTPDQFSIGLLDRRMKKRQKSADLQQEVWRRG